MQKTICLLNNTCKYGKPGTFMNTLHNKDIFKDPFP